MATPPAPGGIPAYGVGGTQVVPDEWSSYTFQKGEMVTTIILYSVLFLDLVLLAYAFIAGRHYRPLRARQPFVMLVSVIGARFEY